MNKQIVLIHGGDMYRDPEAYLEYLKKYPLDFERHALRKAGYQENLAKHLGEGFQVIRPEMPNKRNARYVEWKIWFEKFFPFLEDGVILAGGSLGGIFLAKYLAENDFPKKIKALFLIAAPSADNPPKYKLLDFALPDSLDKIHSQAEKIFLYHSTDDEGVPIADLERYKHALPEATIRVFNDRGHFKYPDLPELVTDIKSL